MEDCCSIEDRGWKMEYREWRVENVEIDLGAFLQNSFQVRLIFDSENIACHVFKTRLAESLEK
jgi:hypothetical protein